MDVFLLSLLLLFIQVSIKRSINITKFNYQNSILNGQQMLLQRNEKIMKYNNESSLSHSNITRYLCVSYVQTSVYDMSRIHKNAHYIPCDWVLIFYDISNITIKEQFCNDSQFHPYRLIHCNMSSITSYDLYDIRIKYKSELISEGRSYEYSKFIPKNIMHIDLLPYLYMYDKVNLYL